jgi:hypothetical protein
MVTDEEEHRIKKYIRNWADKKNEMKNLFYMVEDSFPKLSSLNRMFSGKTKMHGLLKKNTTILDTTEKEWHEKKFNFFDERNDEFNRNYDDFMRLFHKYEKKIPAKK